MATSPDALIRSFRGLNVEEALRYVSCKLQTVETYVDWLRRDLHASAQPVRHAEGSVFVGVLPWYGGCVDQGGVGLIT